MTLPGSKLPIRSATSARENRCFHHNMQVFLRKVGKASNYPRQLKVSALPSLSPIHGREDTAISFTSSPRGSLWPQGRHSEKPENNSWIEKQCCYETCLTEPTFHTNCPWDSILKSKHQKDPALQNTLLSQAMRDETTQAAHISVLPQPGSKQCTSECLPQNGFHRLQCWLWAFHCMQASTNLKCGKGPRNLSPKTNAWNSTMLSVRTWRLPNNRLGQPWHIWCFSKSPVGMTQTSPCSWQASSCYTEDQQSPKNLEGS